MDAARGYHTKGKAERQIPRDTTRVESKITQMDLSTKQKQTHGQREQTHRQSRFTEQTHGQREQTHRQTEQTCGSQGRLGKGRIGSLGLADANDYTQDG